MKLCRSHDILPGWGWSRLVNKCCRGRMGPGRFDVVSDIAAGLCPVILVQRGAQSKPGLSHDAVDLLQYLWNWG